jgi:hypothetical protein
MKHSTNNHASQVLPVQTDIFVVAWGTDIEAGQSPAIDAFRSRSCAERAVESLNQNDNGVRHELVNRSTAIGYAQDYGRKLPTFFSDEYYQESI